MQALFEARCLLDALRDALRDARLERIAPAGARPVLRSSTPARLTSGDKRRPCLPHPLLARQSLGRHPARDAGMRWPHPTAKQHSRRLSSSANRLVSSLNLRRAPATKPGGLCFDYFRTRKKSSARPAVQFLAVQSPVMIRIRCYRIGISKPPLTPNDCS